MWRHLNVEQVEPDPSQLCPGTSAQQPISMAPGKQEPNRLALLAGTGLGKLSPAKAAATLVAGPAGPRAWVHLQPGQYAGHKAGRQEPCSPRVPAVSLRVPPCTWRALRARATRGRQGPAPR